MKYLPIGITNFNEMIQKHYYYCDKTLIIKDFLDYKAKLTLITRPRRFGKTLTMSMMSEFFDITKDSKELFKGTKIMDTEYASVINQYPVIYLSFASCKGSEQAIISVVKSQILDQYIKYQFVFEHLDYISNTIYNNIINE